MVKVNKPSLTPINRFLRKEQVIYYIKYSEKIIIKLLAETIKGETKYYKIIKIFNTKILKIEELSFERFTIILEKSRLKINTYIEQTIYQSDILYKKRKNYELTPGKEHSEIVKTCKNCNNIAIYSENQLLYCKYCNKEEI